MPKKRGSNEEFLNPGARRFRPPEVMPRKLKAAIYVRVSTRYQVDKDSLPFQKEELINYIKYALNIEDYEIFEDAGYSAKNTSRPKFQEMMSRIRNNEFTHLVVYKIDRISRNLLDFAQMYEELQKHNCSFVSKVEPVRYLHRYGRGDDQDRAGVRGAGAEDDRGESHGHHVLPGRKRPLEWSSHTHRV